MTKPGSWGRPAVSPDGRMVAFTGFRDVEQDALRRRSLCGSVRGRRDDARSAPTSIATHSTCAGRPTARACISTPTIAGRAIYNFASINGGVRAVTTGMHMLTMDSASKDMMAAGTVTDPDHPAEVVRFNLRRPGGDDSTHQRERRRCWPARSWAKTEEITYSSTGSANVQGWIVKPPDFDPAKKYPLILEIHGGPYGNYNVGFNYMWQNFAANDFVVLYVNPRGSTGYGTAFSGAIDHNYPGPDYDDLMAGVDAAIGKGFVDYSRCTSPDAAAGASFRVGSLATPTGSPRRPCAAR